jgi:carbon storage regulator
MLVLSRNPEEAILIGDNVRIVVLGVRGQTVRLGIEADRSIRVDRQEVREQISRGRIETKGVE